MNCTNRTLAESFYSAPQVAEIMGLHLNTVLKSARTGEIPYAEKYLRSWRFNKTKLDEWLAKVSAGEESLTQHMDDVTKI
jgi:excisionase family DNA binding protein